MTKRTKIRRVLIRDRVFVKDKDIWAIQIFHIGLRGGRSYFEEGSWLTKEFNKDWLKWKRRSNLTYKVKKFLNYYMIVLPCADNVEIFVLA